VSEYPCCGAFCTGEVHFGSWLCLGETLLGGCFPRPGLGPAADLLFFASPKKRRQKKGDPTVCVPPLRYGQPAVLDVGGGPQNSLRSNSCGPYPSYVCAPRRSQKGVGNQQAIAALGLLNSLHWPSLRSARRPTSASTSTAPVATRTHSKHGRRAAPAVPWGPSNAMARASPLPSGCAEERSVSRIRARSCLSEASSARPRETRAPQVAPSQSEGVADSGVAFSLPTFFWRSKRK